VSGLAALLAGHEPPGVHRWHGASDVADVRHTVEHAGWAFAHVDGWTGADSKPAFLAAVGEALHFPDHYGHNYDALTDCLRDLGDGAGDGAGGVDVAGVVLLWDGWSTLARADEKAFTVVLDVLEDRTRAARGVPFAVLLRGEGPELPGIGSLD